MANLHEKLYTSGDATEVNLKDYLPDIAKSLLNMYDSNINVFESIDSCLIDLDLAVSLGLILTEIINNTVKYAFPNNEEGHFFIKFHQKKDMGVLEFFDDGVGLPEGFDFDSSNGLGMTVIKTLTNQIEGESEIVSDKGAHFKIVFPL
jgi:two-component sensor histidine kinase